MKKHLAGIMVAMLVIAAAWRIALLPGPGQRAFAQPQESTAVKADPTPTPQPTPAFALVRVHKKSVSETGVISVNWGQPYLCKDVQYVRGNASIRMILVTEGTLCDQPNGIPDKSKLTASGRIIVRKDNLADFDGQFRIIDPTGVVIVSGAMHLFHKIGTHHAPLGPNNSGCEACNPERHMEGWLTGTRSNTRPAERFNALITASAGLPTVVAGQSSSGPIVAASLDGDFIPVCAQ
jgi:hypothetical protein